MVLLEYDCCNDETALQTGTWMPNAQGCNTTAGAGEPADSQAYTNSTEDAQTNSTEDGKMRGSACTNSSEDVQMNWRADDVEDEDLHVRWMTTGDIVCTVPCRPQDRITEVKKKVQEQTDVPVKEQRLFAGDNELSTDAVLPDMYPSDGLMLVRSVTDPRVTNLRHFYPSTQYEAVPSGKFKSVKRLAEGINGDIFRYSWDCNGSEKLVAVKKIRKNELVRDQDHETDDRVLHLEPWKGQTSHEDALTEIGIFSYLSKQADVPRYILAMLGVFAEPHLTWLVLEFADGGELFDVAAAGPVAEKKQRQYMWQLLQAIAYLHKHQIGHRDISLENVLLKGDEVRLMDFGMAVKSHSASGTPLRFFRYVGKDFYRAPECYVPTSDQVRIAAPDDAVPGAVTLVRTSDGYLCEVRMPADVKPNRTCMAELWGYAAQPADIFSVGICMFIMGNQCPPWHFARLTDPSFAYKHNRGDDGLAGILQQWKKPLLSPQVMTLLSSMLRSDPVQRPSALECLASPWFTEDEQLCSMPVPVHER
mmetsp:Transcript_54495/g.97782  ORF Transcript_54495/g.97782 Transcript_54495/m.97782 type:complete len:533 (-) Transcript_54495:273-1871(-)